MTGFGAMTPAGTALTRTAHTFTIPSLAPPTGPGDPPAAPRFADIPVHWLHVPPGAAVKAFARATRRVYQGLTPGLPDGTPGTGVLLEVSPLPGFIVGALRHLAGGLPVQYVLLNESDASLIATPTDEVVVDTEQMLLTPAGASWLAVCSQDRVCRDPRGWAQAIDAAAAAGATPRTPDWSGFVAAVAATGGPRIRLLDHTGRPLQAGTVQISTGASIVSFTSTAVSDGDSGVDVPAVGAHVAIPGDGGALLASADTVSGMIGQPLALSPTDRHVLVSNAAAWFAPRSPGVTRMARWTSGNTVEPIVDGTPYFARLVPDLRAAEGGGAVQLAGWAFVKEALQDKTKPWSLLPEDNSTEVVTLIDELVTHGANVRMLVNQFLQIGDQQLETLAADAAVVILASFVGLGITQFAHWTTTDPAGWVLLIAAMGIIPQLPNSLLRDLLRSVAEPSKPAVEDINNAHPGTAVWTPYAAALADNPLAEHPLTIAGVNVEFVNHFGVYHQKIAMAKPPGGDPIAYVGGIDINSDRVDDPVHRAIAPFHDVQVRLTGPVVNEVAITFDERATYHATTAPITPAADSTTLSGPGRHVVQIGRTYFAPAAGSGSRPLPSAPNGEHTTHDTLLQAIANAREYIYIEDQYFTPDTAYVDALAAAGDRGVPALIVTVPERTDQPFGARRRGAVIHRLADHWHDRFRIGAPLRRYLNPEPGTFGGLGRMVLRKRVLTGDNEFVLGPADRLPKPPFWAFVESELVRVDSPVAGGPGTGPIGPQDPSDPDPADQTWQRVHVQRGPGGWGAKPDNHDKGSCVLAVQIPGIYVHAKLMVIDDVFVSVGSSNLNRRGHEHDGEINSFTVPASLKRDPANPALRLRCRLWAEHLGLPPELGLSLLADPLSALPYFDRSWYRGNRWQRLRFASSSDPPVISIPTADSVFAQLMDIAEGVVLAAEQSAVWASLVDPTTANDVHINPATDRGPGL